MARSCTERSIDFLPGDIILVRGVELHHSRREWFRWVLSWLISVLTGSPYTHAAIYIRNGKVIDCDVGRPVRASPLADLDFYDVYRVAGATPQEREEAVLFCLRQLGKRYDYTAVLAIAAARVGLRLPRRWEDPRRWFCSELISAAWQLCPDTWRVTPGDMSMSPGLYRIKNEKRVI